MSSTSKIVAPAMTNDIEAIGIDEVDRRLAETCDNEEIMNIITEWDGTKRQLNAERQRVSELEDQLSSLSKPNESLINRILLCNCQGRQMNNRRIYFFSVWWIKQLTHITSTFSSRQSWATESCSTKRGIGLGWNEVDARWIGHTRRIRVKYTF